MADDIPAAVPGSARARGIDPTATSCQGIHCLREQVLTDDESADVLAADRAVRSFWGHGR